MISEFKVGKIYLNNSFWPFDWILVLKILSHCYIYYTLEVLDEKGNVFMLRSLSTTDFKEVI